MAKAVLIMDMPESCVYCPLSRLLSGIEDGIECEVAGRINRICKVIPDRCPLRELPEEVHNDNRYDEYLDGYDAGWNACLDEILKTDGSRKE